MRNKLFPFILSSEHLAQLSGKDSEISRLNQVVSELSDNIKNDLQNMNQEETTQWKSQLDALENKVNQMEARFAKLESGLIDFQSKLSTFLNAPAAQSAVAAASAEIVAAGDTPQAVLSNVDILNDFHTALEKIEAAYGR